jgi:hypothetical protein
MGVAVSQRDFAAALLSPAAPIPAGIRSPRGGTDAARFAVYRNNVFVGLTRALAQRFPITDRLVGAEFFTGMARAYAQDRWPVSPLMFEYGSAFPDFVASFPPAAGLPYLADIARLEAAWTDAYHAADAAPLDLSALATVAPERLAVTRLVPHPAARLVRSAHPAGSIWAGHRTNPVTPPARWEPETVLVARPGMDVNVHVLPARDAPFAAALLDSATLGEAVAACAGADFDFGAALVGLVGLGAFSAISDGEPE